MLPVIISAIETPEDRELMTLFYEKNSPRMFREAEKYLDRQEDVEDTVYEALARIIDKMELFRTLAPSQRLCYGLTTVRNLCYMTLRSRQNGPEISLDAMDWELPQPPEAQPYNQVERQQLLAHIRSVWQELELPERMLLEQKYILRWKDEELAQTLGIKTQSVRMRITRAKRNLMAQLQSKGVNLADWIPSE